MNTAITTEQLVLILAAFGAFTVLVANTILSYQAAQNAAHAADLAAASLEKSKHNESKLNEVHISLNGKLSEYRDMVIREAREAGELSAREGEDARVAAVAATLADANLAAEQAKGKTTD